MLKAAMAEAYAVGYFESWNLESLQGVIDAAEAARAPTLVGFNGEFLSRPGRLATERLAWYAALGRAAAESATVPCGLVFNECARDAWVRGAVDAGFGQVMLDDPDAPPESLAARVAAVTAYAHARGAASEAETGRLPFGEAEAAEGEMTRPDAAAEFVRQTGIDILAVSVGNVHVLTKGSRGLDLERLSAIRRCVGVPFDLHGGTGIDPASLRQAIGLGVAKVSFGTYLKQRYLDAVRRALARSEGEANPHALLGMGGPEDVLVAGRLAVRDAVLERIPLLGCGGRA
jgi:fructose/tagatose bisphosphate aldolase